MAHYCRKCGTYIEDETDVFCKNCGERQIEEKPKVKEMEPVTYSKPSVRDTKWLIIGFIVAFISAVLIGFFGLIVVVVAIGLFIGMETFDKARSFIVGCICGYALGIFILIII